MFSCTNSKPRARTRATISGRSSRRRRLAARELDVNAAAGFGERVEPAVDFFEAGVGAVAVRRGVAHRTGEIAARRHLEQDAAALLAMIGTEPAIVRAAALDRRGGDRRTRPGARRQAPEAIGIEPAPDRRRRSSRARGRSCADRRCRPRRCARRESSPRHIGHTLSVRPRVSPRAGLFAQQAHKAASIAGFARRLARRIEAADARLDRLEDRVRLGVAAVGGREAPRDL